MWQRNHHRPFAKLPADAIFERTWAEEPSDRQLPDQDQHFRLQDLQLGVEPVRAIGDGFGWRLQVAIAGAIAAGEAPQQRRDVSQPPKLIGACKPCADHPPVELLAGPARKRPSRLPLDRPRRLTDHEERRAPPPRAPWGRARDDAFVHAHVTRAAGGLETEQRPATVDQLQDSAIRAQMVVSAQADTAIRAQMATLIYR